MAPERIFILTGAGISVESGLGTFRDEDGLWTEHNLEDVASIDGYIAYFRWIGWYRSQPWSNGDSVINFLDCQLFNGSTVIANSGQFTLYGIAKYASNTSKNCLHTATEEKRFCF